MILAEFVDAGHSGSVITTAKIIDKGIGSIIVADCNHGIQIVIQFIFSVGGGKTVIIFVYSAHDIELDQAGSLHLLVIDGTFGIFCKVTYVYRPGTVAGRKKGLYLIQKIVHAGIRIIRKSTASTGRRKSTFFLRRAVLTVRRRGRACNFSGILRIRLYACGSSGAGNGRIIRIEGIQLVCLGA